MILADGSSQGQTVVTEENRACKEAAHDAESEAATSKQKPVEVVCAPEPLEEHSLLHDSLLLSSVKAAGIDKTKLEPGSDGVAV